MHLGIGCVQRRRQLIVQRRGLDLGCTAKLLLLSWNWRVVVRALTSSLICNLTYVVDELRARVDVTEQLPVVLFMKYFLQKIST